MFVTSSHASSSIVQPAAAPGAARGAVEGQRRPPCYGAPVRRLPMSSEPPTRTQRAATRHPFVRTAQERQLQSQRAPAGSSARPAARCAAGRPRRSDVVVRGQARPEGVRCRSRAAGQRAADGKKFGFWAPCRREAASCCPSRNLGAITEIDDAAGAHACGGRGLASPSMRAISSGMLDIKDGVCKNDELHGRVDGVRAREQQRSERGCMHGGKTYALAS